MKLIILDRDGVLNYESELYIKSPEEWVPLPRSLEAVARLKQAGYTVAVATNQGGVGRGYYDIAALDSIHDKMQQALRQLGGCIDTLVYCPHHPDDRCGCRKPETGLFEQIAETYSISLKNIPMVGDSLRDMQAAQAMGCRFMLVRTGNGEDVIKDNPSIAQQIEVFSDLSEAVDSLLESR